MDQILLQGPLDCLKCQIWQETYAQKVAMMWEFYQDSTLKSRDGIEGFSMKLSASASIAAVARFGSAERPMIVWVRGLACASSEINSAQSPSCRPYQQWQHLGNKF